MTNNIAGSLIEMNVHLQRTIPAGFIMMLGIFAIVICLICVLWYLGNFKKYPKQIVVSIIILAIGVCIFVYGYKMPLDRIISYCANGPVSIEELSGRYDIVKIDGKLIQLKERR